MHGPCVHTSHAAPFMGGLSGQGGGAAQGGHRPTSQCPLRHTYVQPQHSGSGSQVTPSGAQAPPDSPHAVPPVPATAALPAIPPLPDVAALPPLPDVAPVPPLPLAPPWAPVPPCAPPPVPASRTLSSSVDPPQAPCPIATTTDKSNAARRLVSVSMAHRLASTRRVAARSRSSMRDQRSTPR